MLATSYLREIMRRSLLLLLVNNFQALMSQCQPLPSLSSHLHRHTAIQTLWLKIGVSLEEVTWFLDHMTLAQNTLIHHKLPLNSQAMPPRCPETPMCSIYQMAACW